MGIYFDERIIYRAEYHEINARIKLIIIDAFRFALNAGIESETRVQINVGHDRIFSARNSKIIYNLHRGISSLAARRARNSRAGY